MLPGDIGAYTDSQLDIATKTKLNAIDIALGTLHTS
jgi:hypothetical protein